MSNQQMKVKVDPIQAQKMIENAESISCECGADVFSQGLMMKKVSALDPANPTGKSQVVNIPVIYCVGCGKQFTPPT